MPVVCTTCGSAVLAGWHDNGDPWYVNEETLDMRGGADPVLLRLVSLVNAMNGHLKIGLTVLVGGRLITGQLVSAANHFQDAVRQTRAIGLDDDASDAEVAEFHALVTDNLRWVYEHAADLSPDPVVNPDSHGPEPVDTAPPAYLHLAEARLVDAPVVCTTKGGMRMRIRLASVEGFSLQVPTLTER
jgi:hypothetical protein